MAPIVMTPMNAQPITKTVCEIDLSVLVEATVDHPDEEIRTKAQQFVGSAFQLREQITIFASQLESESLAALTATHQALLAQREDVIVAQQALLSDAGLVDNNVRRDDQAAGRASFALNNHLKERPDPKYTRLEKIEDWERRKVELEKSLAAANETRADAHGYKNSIVWNSTKLDNELKAVNHEIETVWGKILHLRGETPQPPQRIAPQVGIGLSA